MSSAPQKPETFLLSAEAESALPQQTQLALHQVDDLKYFLVTAPVEWPNTEYIKRHALPTAEYISCVLWNNLFHISGTDIVRCLAFRFQAFGRPVKNAKKFEEGIFSDLRNLKAGTDASLEEPKSPFLDFLFKNNCIRTQKKQKVFFWYSVPHDRLFLDALERDLKREKAGQETTTTAEREPALSFEFDASQTLFEQLTKAQQPNTSSFDTVQQTYSRSASPNVRAIGSMPPPSTVSQAMFHVPKVALNDMSIYSQTTIPAAVSVPIITNPIMATAMPMQTMPKRAQYYGQVPFDRNGFPMSQLTPRHSSVPTQYMDSYSPAPSFMSSQTTLYDDYSTNRGISYEPLTPPQPFMQYHAEPSYMPTEDHSFYTSMSDIPQTYGNFTPQPIMTTPSYGPIQGSVPRQFPVNPVYGQIGGSPTYKQRRRNSSLTQGFNAAATAGASVPTSFIRTPHTVHRPSDLRRSVSASVPPADESPSGIPFTLTAANQTTTELGNGQGLSRGGTPLPTIEAQQSVPLMKQRYANLMNGMNGAYLGPQPYLTSPSGPGVIRRARSATVTELGPYPHKAHSCPIPSCGKLFKRLEHLKRHVRTHTQERPYVCTLCNRTFSRSDNLAQHRRTHETDADGNPLAVYSDEDGLEDEATSPNVEEGVTDGMTQDYMPNEQSMDSLGDMSELFSLDTTSVMPGHMDFGMMGPPPMPVSAQGY